MTQDIFSSIRGGASVWIADGGSTKAHWMAFSGGRLVAQTLTTGFNPHHNGKEEISARLLRAFTGLIEGGAAAPSGVGYYGAGCSSERICAAMRVYVTDCLAEVLPGAHPAVEIGSDIVLACKAVAGDEPCITGILGTGSNTVVWDGKRIAAHIAPLGYLLGDEGSGASIGSLILADVLRGRAPQAISSAVCGTRCCAEVQEELYRCTSPAAVMANALKTAAQVQGDGAREYVDSAARKALKQFFESIVDAYPRDSYGNRLCFVGSVAVMYRHIIEQLAIERGLTLHKVVRRPLEGFLESLEE